MYDKMWICSSGILYHVSLRHAVNIYIRRIPTVQFLPCDTILYRASLSLSLSLFCLSGEITAYEIAHVPAKYRATLTKVTPHMYITSQFRTQALVIVQTNMEVPMTLTPTVTLEKMTSQFNLATSE